MGSFIGVKSNNVIETFHCILLNLYDKCVELQYLEFIVNLLQLFKYISQVQDRFHLQYCH